MQGQIPTLISLPYGRCPPLHFQASSWRHMLKLMARLSSTKMEPSIEAMVVIKNEVLKLRTVIQFIKVKLVFLWCTEMLIFYSLITCQMNGELSYGSRSIILSLPTYQTLPNTALPMSIIYPSLTRFLVSLHCLKMLRIHPFPRPTRYRLQVLFPILLFPLHFRTLHYIFKPRSMIRECRVNLVPCENWQRWCRHVIPTIWCLEIWMNRKTQEV